MVTFSSLAHISKDMKHPISMRLLAYPCGGHSHFPHNFPSSYEYPIHYQSVGSSCSSIGHIGYFNYVDCLHEHGLDGYQIWSHNLISFKMMSFWYMFLKPRQSTCHLNLGVLIRKVIVQRLFTLTLRKTCVVRILFSLNLHLLLIWYEPHTIRAR